MPPLGPSAGLGPREQNGQGFCAFALMDAVLTPRSSGELVVRSPLVLVGVGPMAMTPRQPTTFEAFREFTGWVRPGRDHGCKPVTIVDRVWTAHYHDIDSVDKLKEATGGAKIVLVVNTAPAQCEARQGFWGPDVRVLDIPLEDDPDERKQFDQGKPNCQSQCKDPSVALEKRCAGDAKQYFTAVSRAIDEVLAGDGEVMVHCHASLSRSTAFLLAHLMRSRKLSLLDAAKLMKPRWDATWPCDRFAFQLLEYEGELAEPFRLSGPELGALLTQATFMGAGTVLFAMIVIRVVPPLVRKWK